jgi:tRNA G10  N-methylase Trm11
MNIGMLPPKLAQMMINLSLGNTIYDPFVGLGTVLIESVHMGNNRVFGSDLNPRMVTTANDNLKNLQKNLTCNHTIFLQNAKYIHEIEIGLNNLSIVTE